jgi:hypothetical protein
LNSCLCNLPPYRSESLWSFGTFDFSTLAIALFTLWAVHRLTRTREREKYVFDLCKTIEGCAKEVSDAAFDAWADAPSAERLRSVALVRSQLQMLGALLNRLEILTNGWRMRWTFEGPGAVNAKIALGHNLVKLRRALTDDPFDDPERLPDHSRAVACTADVSLFILELDLALRNWIKPY